MNLFDGFVEFIEGVGHVLEELLELGRKLGRTLGLGFEVARVRLHKNKK
jgi:hypothetical protein